MRYIGWTLCAIAGWQIHARFGVDVTDWAFWTIVETAVIGGILIGANKAR